MNVEAGRNKTVTKQNRTTDTVIASSIIQTITDWR